MSGTIEVSCTEGKTVLTSLYSTYPIRLVVQEPWMEHASVVHLGFGGGLLAGDYNNLHIVIRNSAKLSLRTQGSTKLFKSNTLSRANYSIRVEENSLFALLPDSATCFSGARYAQQIHVKLDTTSSIVLVDWFTAGRQGRDQDWDINLLDNDIYIERDGLPVFIENQKLRNTAFSSIRDKLGNCTVFGCVILCGPKTESIRARLSALQQRMTFQQYSEEKFGVNSAYTDAETHNAEEADAVPGIFAPSLVSVSDIDTDSKILHFQLGGEEEAYEVLHEVLRPLSEQLVGCRAYADRLCVLEDQGGSAQKGSHSGKQYPSTHPISLLRQFDQSI